MVVQSVTVMKLYRLVFGATLSVSPTGFYIKGKHLIVESAICYWHDYECIDYDHWYCGWKCKPGCS